MHPDTHRVSVSCVLPASPPLGFLRQAWSSCWPGHVTSAVLDQHETLLAGGRGGGHSHQAPACVKTCHETKINRGAAFALLSVVSLCACSKGDDSPQLLQHFPKTSRCTRLELHQWKKKEYKETMSCMVNYHVFTERLIPSASIPRPPELRSVQVWTKRALRGRVNRTVRWEPDVWACERSREKLRILSCFGAWREQPMSPECVGRIESPCVCSIRGGNKAERSASHLKS